MSGMADEMAARMAAAGETPAPTPETGAVPGNAGTASPPAEASNTVDAPAPGTPESIPYARFKEVNDRLAALRDYEQFPQYGYDADSLRRLAAFEQQYNTDPLGVWRSMASNLALPEELMTAINTHVDRGPEQATEQGQAGQPVVADPVKLPEDVTKKLEYVDSMMAREEQQEREAKVDAVVAAWDALDQQAGMTTSTRTKLTWISAAAGGGQVFETVESLAKAAWDARMQERDADLNGAVSRPPSGGVPALPGSAPVPAPPVKFGTLAEASKAAEEDIRSGRL